MSYSIRIYIKYLKFKIHSIFSKKNSILFVFLLFSLSVKNLSAQTKQVLAVRVQSSQNYTRIILENNDHLRVKHFFKKNPERLVIDIQDIYLNKILKQLITKIKSNDHYIKKIYIIQHRQNVVRLVLNFKKKIKPQFLILMPIRNYKYRFIINFYPVNHIIHFIPHSSKSQNKLSMYYNTLPFTRTKKKITVINTIPSNKYKKIFKRMITIAVDPGHGGEDPGAIGSHGNLEKDVVLSIAKNLKSKIETQPKMRVILTRDADFFVSLKKRVQKARKIQADLFVSIHTNAFMHSRASGSSVFILSEKGAISTTADWLANIKNTRNLIGGINVKLHDKHLAKVLLDLSTTAQMNDSLNAGKAILNEINNINKLHCGIVEKASFAVLKAPDIPSILIETAFISNHAEEAKLINKHYQNDMANAIFIGIKKYFSKNPAFIKKKLT